MTKKKEETKKAKVEVKKVEEKVEVEAKVKIKVTPKLRKSVPRPTSRPGVMYAAITKKGLTLKQLLENKTVLTKYNNNKSWIKSDFASLTLFIKQNKESVKKS